MAAWRAWCLSQETARRAHPRSPESRGAFIGEYPWHPAWRETTSWVDNDLDWPLPYLSMCVDYFWEKRNDFSISDSIRLKLPCAQLMQSAALSWAGTGADFVDAAGGLAATDPSGHNIGPEALLVRPDVLTRFLHDRDCALIWHGVIEKYWMSPNGDDAPGRREGGFFAVMENTETEIEVIRFELPYEDHSATVSPLT